MRLIRRVPSRTDRQFWGQAGPEPATRHGRASRIRPFVLLSRLEVLLVYSLLVALLVVLALAIGLAHRPEDGSCEIRARTIDVLFDAANDAGIAAHALRAGRKEAAAARIAEIAARLGDEETRITSADPQELAERDSMVPVLRTAREHGGEDADALRAALESALAAQSESWAASHCAGLELAVDELWIRPDERRVVPGGTKIVAANGAAVLGELATRGAGAVALETVLGDLILEGRIDASAGPNALRIEAWTGNVRVGPKFSAITGGDVVVTAAAGSVDVAPRGAGEPVAFSPGRSGEGFSGRLDHLSFHGFAPVER
jgi:hypothetical protein